MENKEEFKEAHRRFNEKMVKSGGLTSDQLAIMAKSAKKELIEDLSKVTRIEVIDENGRSYVNKSPYNKVELSYQDDSRTLKVFISKTECDHEYSDGTGTGWNICKKCGGMS